MTGLDSPLRRGTSFRTFGETVRESAAMSGFPAQLSEPLGRLFPLGVIVAELRPVVGVEVLRPEEIRDSEGFSPKRLREFAGGRVCARRVLAELGHDGFALRRGADRRPIWPDGIVGSITHSSGYCAAAAAPARIFRAIGLDAERVGVERGLWPQICLPAEIEWLESLPAELRTTAATLIFSAKEAFYKCLCGAGGGWLDFHDVAVRIEGPEFAVNGTLLAVLLRSNECGVSANRALAGGFRIDGDLVMTGLALTADG
jgi:4'-phosphopantetheinyl transferase EntD